MNLVIGVDSKYDIIDDTEKLQEIDKSSNYKLYSLKYCLDQTGRLIAI
jgi:hypothetical protein